MVRSAQGGGQLQHSMHRDESDSCEHVAHAAERCWALVMPQYSRSAWRPVCSASVRTWHSSERPIVLRPVWSVSIPAWVSPLCHRSG